MQKSSKTIVEIPAGGFYIYNPKKQPNVIPTSDGAFGCCYLTIKDGDNILVAHINATSIMIDSVAKQTVQNMLTAFANAGGIIENAETTIVHSNDPLEYEMGFENRPTNLTKDQWERRGHYSERMEDSEKYPYVAEPFAHVALQKALENEGVKNIKPNKENFNSNLGEFMSNGNAPAIKTDIIIGSNGETYLRNVAHDFNNNTKEAIKHSENGAEAVFKQVEILSYDKINNKIFKPNWQETPPVGKFYVSVANDIKNGFISVENSIGTTKEGCNDYSQFAVMDINKYVESKIKPQKEPLYIFIGENHEDFSYIELTSNLLKSCQSEGLNVEVYSEFGNQVHKAVGYSSEIRQQFPERPPSDEELTTLKLKTMPKNWLETAQFVNHAITPIRDSNDERGLCQPYVEKMQKLSIAEIIKQYPPHQALFEAKVQPWLDEYQKNGGDINTYSAKDTDNFLQEHLRPFVLPVINKARADDIAKNTKNPDVIIVWTGLFHTENMIKELNPKQMVVVSNFSKENDDLLKAGKYLTGVDIVPFENGEVPNILEEKFVGMEKMKQLDSKPIQTSFIQKIEQKVEAKLKQPTNFIENLKSERGRSSSVISIKSSNSIQNNTTRLSSVDRLKEQRAKEGKQSKGGHNK